MPQDRIHCAVSAADKAFLERFESLHIAAGDFHHREHIRLAYVYLAALPANAAHLTMRAALQAFLRHYQVDPAKYHETMTRAWILAVAHFMRQSPPTASADAFIEANPELLNVDIMLSHYSRDRLFSERARTRYLAPDLEPIP